ncbi:hypothetical protein [Polaromonas sp. CG_9.11]|uniref:hypothetical protein n=1 Tax=Polaromonas sp. CG_9.11 TaxID=2787730 RepID=UPI001E2F5418|nr:hypothetical protein [Polaromonas sp. CG_9.11]
MKVSRKAFIAVSKATLFDADHALAIHAKEQKDHLQEISLQQLVITAFPCSPPLAQLGGNRRPPFLCDCVAISHPFKGPVT